MNLLLFGKQRPILLSNGSGWFLVPGEWLCVCLCEGEANYWPFNDQTITSHFSLPLSSQVGSLPFTSKVALKVSLYFKI